ncbi:MAG: hypothetical protein ACKVU4_05470 [Phycisphaerales bacterium]
MSVRDRLQDAAALINAGRYTGALAITLIAAVGTATKRRPRQNRKPREFDVLRDFLRDEMRTITDGYFHILRREFPDGRKQDLAEILAGIVRDGLVHDATMPGGFGVSAAPGWLLTFPPGGHLVISLGVLRGLVRAVALAPENVSEISGLSFWVHHRTDVAPGWTVDVSEDWITGAIESTPGFGFIRVRHPLMVSPTPDAPVGSVRIEWPDGTTAQFPTEPGVAVTVRPGESSVPPSGADTAPPSGGSCTR